MSTKIQLIFSNSKLPLSPFIRFVTWSDWSHVGLLVDGNLVIESTISQKGVKTATVQDFKLRAKNWAIYDLQVNHPQAVLNAALTQIGRPYDKTGILGVGLHRDWQEEDSWFCSELVLWALSKDYMPKYNPRFIRRGTPQHCLMICGDLVACG